MDNKPPNLEGKEVRVKFTTQEEAAEKNKEHQIRNAATAEDLYRVLYQIGSVTSDSGTVYEAKYLIETIQKYLKGEVELDSITRKYGIRDKAEALQKLNQN